MNQSLWTGMILAGLMLSCAAPAPSQGKPEPKAERSSVPLPVAGPVSALHVVEHEAADCKLCSLYEVVAAATFVVQSPSGLGSAVLVAQGGLAVTNAHVVGDAPEVAILQNDGKQFVGRVLHKNVIEDFALIQIEGLGEDRRPLSLALGAPRAGSEVYAVGHPLGLGWTISRGIVSGLPVLGNRPMVQTDAPISSGNSGGPLVDEHGHVIGIITEKIAGLGAEGLAFARPADVLKLFLEDAGLEISHAHSEE